MKKIFLIFSLLLSTSFFCYSQTYVGNNSQYNNAESTSMFDKSKLTLGGNFSLQFGDYTVIGLSPQLGYNFSKYFTAGAGFGYTYFHDSDDRYDWKRSYLSFDLFGRFYPVEYLVVGIQPEMSRMWETVKLDNNSYKSSKFVPSFLVGVGVRFGGVTAMVQYDVVQDDNSPYGDELFYSLGYSFGF